MKKNLNKIMIKVFTCLVLSILTSSEILTSTSVKEADSQYLPITNYQNTLSQMIANFIAKYIYKKPDIQKLKPKVFIRKNPTMTRDKALDEIKQTTTKLFDLNDPHHISVHLNTMKELSENLYTEIDKKTITAIHFLLENQHRSSLLDTFFWTKAIKEKELDTAIPMTPEVANKSKIEKLAALRKKMAIEVQPV